MATLFNQFNDDNKLFLSRIKDFVDDVSEFKCKQCGNVLIKNYISNCGHAFCSNCRNLLEDGSCRRKCPEYVTETHLKTCKFNEESALPVLYKAIPTMETIFEEMENYNQNFAKLKAEIEALKATIVTNQIATDKKLKELKCQIDLVKSDLHKDTSGINTKLAKMKRNASTRKYDAMFIKYPIRSMEKRRVNNRLKQELSSDLKNLKSTLKDAIKIKNENINKVKVNSAMQLKAADKKIKITNQELEMIKLKTDPKMDFKDEIEPTQFIDMKNKIQSVKPQLSRLHSYFNLAQMQVQPTLLKIIHSNRKADYVWNITDAENMLKYISMMKLNITEAENDLELKEKFEDGLKSDLFPLNNYAIQAQASLYFDFDAFKSEVRLHDLELPGSDVHPRLMPLICLVIRDQSEEQDSDILRYAFQHFGSSKDAIYEFSKVELTELLDDPDKYSYIKDNTLRLEVYVEPSSMTTHAFSFDGTLSWFFSDYQKKKESETLSYANVHESPYFYTSPNGYRMSVCMSLIHKGLSAYVLFLTGEFDKNLGTSFPHKTTVTIFNQKNPKKHITKSATYNEIESGYSIYLGSHKKIDNIVVNDTLFYEVTIEAI